MVVGLGSTLSTLLLSLHRANTGGLPCSLGLFAGNALVTVGAVRAGIFVGKRL